MLDRDVVYVDLETTGATAQTDRITEIGIVEIAPDGTASEWSTLVNPGRPIPPFIEGLTGISDAMVATAPPFADLADALHRRLDGKLLVAHNARFDYGFLRSEFARIGLTYRSPVLCTVKLSRRLYPAERRHNLDSIMLRHGLACEQRHRALADARVLFDFTRAARRDLGDDAVFDAVRRLLTTPALPARIDPTTMDAIPHAPGVYGFFGEEDVPLYVGRSTDMNARVLSHFSGEHAATKDLQVTRVEWHETIGELEALLLEAGHLRRLDPIHNRRRPGADEPCAFHWDPAVAEAPRLVDGRAVDFDMTGDLFGPFRSPALARRALREIADANNLCHRLAGLERPAPGPCSARVAGRCRGACIDAETPLSHRLRMTTALHRLRMASWPFRGRVGIRETDAAGGRSVIHALDRWRYLGTAKSEHELFDAFERAADIAFDFDTYRILAKWFRQRRGTLDVIDLERR